MSMESSERKIDTGPDIFEIYEIKRCVQWIEENGFAKVTLQFPDDLLYISDKIAIEIQKGVQASKVYILADTSYGSCCVDEIAAEHIGADSVIHFGHACLTACSRLPVLYIFGKFQLDVESALTEFLNVVPARDTSGVFIFDVTFSHAADVLYRRLVDHFPNLVSSTLVFPQTASKNELDISPVPADDTSGLVVCGRLIEFRPDVPLENQVVLYVGGEGATLNTLLLTLNKCQFFSYDPAIGSALRQGLDSNRSLRKRYFAIEAARNAKIVGILMGTLGVLGYLEIIERLKRVAKHAGKKTYTIVVGHLNPEKLANFPEVETFVLVACPENSLLDCKQFYRPIVTPHEFELACNAERQWNLDVVTDFKELLPGAKHYVELPASNESSGDANVSLVKGNLTSRSLQLATCPDPETAVMIRDGVTTVSELHRGKGGEFLANRSWQGLEQNLGQTAASTIHEGLKGIASGYDHEKS